MKRHPAHHPPPSVKQEIHQTLSPPHPPPHVSSPPNMPKTATRPFHDGSTTAPPPAGLQQHMDYDHAPRRRRPSTRKRPSPWLRKPLWTLQLQENNNNNDNHHGQSSSQPHLQRHMTLYDLTCIGVGGTVGSGIFVLCGLIAHNYAGPLTPLSWSLAGLASLVSGACFAELAGRIPTCGSSYAYSYISMGEFPAFLSAACLTLEYLFSGAAVARSWGDKVVAWLQVDVFHTTLEQQEEEGVEWFIQEFLNPGYAINPMAFLVSAGSVALLLHGIQESKAVSNGFTIVKVCLVAFMTIFGFRYFQWTNLTTTTTTSTTPVGMATVGGLRGVLRGATSSFFGYVGYDEVCCLAGEAQNPRKTMPQAVLLTIVLVTGLYMVAALALVGMQPYGEISETSGFPEAFRWNWCGWAAQISAAGEVLTLPVVVLISLTAQPRLQYALSLDGLLPPLFSQVHPDGTLFYGTLYAGILMTLTATFVPFTYMDDLISAGILVAFCMTDSSVVLLRRESWVLSTSSAAMRGNEYSSPASMQRQLSIVQRIKEWMAHDVWLLQKLLIFFHTLSFASCLLVTHGGSRFKFVTYTCWMGLIGLVYLMHTWCPPCAVFGGRLVGGDKNEDGEDLSLVQGQGGSIRSLSQQAAAAMAVGEDGMPYFETPLVPWLPCLGIHLNWYLIAQLEPYGMALLVLYLAAASGFYFGYGAKHSVGNHGGWGRGSGGVGGGGYQVVDSSSDDSLGDENGSLEKKQLGEEERRHEVGAGEMMIRTISLPKVKGDGRPLT